MPIALSQYIEDITHHIELAESFEVGRDLVRRALQLPDSEFKTTFLNSETVPLLAEAPPGFGYRDRAVIGCRWVLLATSPRARSIARGHAGLSRPCNWVPAGSVERTAPSAASHC